MFGKQVAKTLGVGRNWPPLVPLNDQSLPQRLASMSMANVVAAGRGARSIVLLGDPQQLEQPLKGSHPDGSAVSANLGVNPSLTIMALASRLADHLHTDPHGYLA